jgi:hyaluronan synthase
VTAAIALAVAGLARHALFTWDYRPYRPLMAAWSLAFAFSAIQWLLSWRDRPWVIAEVQQAHLDRLHVSVVVPLYNEDPALVDRCIWALVSQSRPPQRIAVVDDGSAVDYSALREHWTRESPEGVEISWIRQHNAGKKHAQSVIFGHDQDADIFVTVDSDTALERNAISEGIKPFAHRDVMSVAGIELAFNSATNWLTRTVSARSMFFQVVACGTQSSFGDMLVNRGAFALYRADLIRDIVPAYIGETFMGRPVRLGDDAALTLFARGRGRAVQQSSAFALTMYPETLSHHIRQWIRWMRGSTIRNCWRLRYLPVRSYGWWFTVIGIQLFLASTIVPVMIVLTWPKSATFTWGAITALVCWAYLTGLRIPAIRRSDEGWWYRLGSLACYAPAMLWGMFVLRPLRFWGIVSCLRQDWTTRTDGAEIGIATSPAHAERVSA